MSKRIINNFNCEKINYYLIKTSTIIYRVPTKYNVNFTELINTQMQNQFYINIELQVWYYNSIPFLSQETGHKDPRK